eukprot:Rhum_TRINITY_DN25441_c0_g1::Rhum_TRINITY_DN25441_c0_g1_i1::g.182144::m.182144
MPIPGVTSAALAGHSYQYAERFIRRLPRGVAISGGVALAGLVGVAAGQTFGVFHVHPWLDMEPPYCKKVQCFVDVKKGLRGDRVPPTHEHRRYPGMGTIKGAKAALHEEFGLKGVHESQAVLSLRDMPNFPLDPSTQLTSLCRSNQHDSKGRQEELPCSVQLDFYYRELTSTPRLVKSRVPFIFSNPDEELDLVGHDGTTRRRWWQRRA